MGAAEGGGAEAKNEGREGENGAEEGNGGDQKVENEAETESGELIGPEADFLEDDVRGPENREDFGGVKADDVQG